MVLVALAVAGALALVPSGAAARGYVPPHHRIFHGVTDTGDFADVGLFRHEVGAHPAVLEDLYHWGTPLGTGALHRWRQSRTRGVLSLSTAPGGEPEIISPGSIAKGRDDEYMLGINRTVAASRQVVYIRLFPEMNGSWNPYCAFNPDGTRRGSNHTAAKFRRAWRRFAVIVRGGRRATINHHLRKLGMPRLLHARSNHDRIYRRAGVPRKLPHPKVAFLWNPQTTGSPSVRGNGLRAYWPGRRYVDWVGADIYAKYATGSAFSKLSSLYRRYRRVPFFIGEYSPWDGDPRGAFVRHLFKWARKHGRTRMLVYYRSISVNNAFDISRFPRAQLALRRLLNRRGFMEYAPGTR